MEVSASVLNFLADGECVRMFNIMRGFMVESCEVLSPIGHGS